MGSANPELIRELKGKLIQSSQLSSIELNPGMSEQQRKVGHETGQEQQLTLKGFPFLPLMLTSRAFPAAEAKQPRNSQPAPFES